MADIKCHLLALPAELRNRIWSLALARDLFRPENEYEPPSILQANQQIRSETLPIHYGQTVFDLDSGQFLEYNSEWLCTIGDLATKQIRHVRLSNPWRCYWNPFTISVVHVSLHKGKATLVWEDSAEKVSDHYWDAWEGVRVKSEADEEAAAVKALLDGEIREMVKHSGEGLTGGDWRALMALFAED
ncbi:hypothetical protein LTR22_015217 [Elasticomyces elasticus]|nr:hypothetical protein LTR22_015217 [Elasticomyces elasticus]KAK4915534.1 hypothetical protein LTR49_016381 [Elasticomyces elasticus]KAK5756251.1 hypothetical protein LTS12_013675 [Elasticomyces elasticus]